MLTFRHGTLLPFPALSTLGKIWLSNHPEVAAWIHIGGEYGALVDLNGELIFLVPETNPAKRYWYRGGAR